jgi:hypothetical protein
MHDLSTLPVATDYSQYDEIMLTGGEPLLHPHILRSIIFDIKEQAPDAKLYVYTAKVDWLYPLLNVLSAVDGMTITLHTEPDVFDFQLLAHKLYVSGKSMRLKVCEGLPMPIVPRLEKFWSVSRFSWMADSPVPEGEDFMRVGGKV